MIICMFTLQQITQLQAHISELNMHAEAQAREYMHKVKMVPYILISFSCFSKILKTVHSKIG